MKQHTKTDFDVIVLGTGISGGIISCILARQGVSVLMIDPGIHPRFTVGESTIPQTSQLIQLMSRDFDVPELAVLGLKAPQAIRDQIAPTCGIKRLFAFIFHEMGQEHDPKQAHQFGNTWRDENHLFRQDIDAWLYALALKYGCEGRQSTKVEDIQVDEVTGVRVTTNEGKTYKAKFIIDGSGHNSILAARFGLREKPCTMHSHTRSLFTHMIGLKDFEEVAPSHMSHPWKLGTVHHIFKGGWFWVIPFNNWEGAPNPLISVGVTVDDRKWPEDPNLTTEQEFAKFLELVPSVAKQFENAQAIRPWIRTKRLQYQSTSTIGPRFALLSHTAGFIDPLFSRGLINTMENINQICRALLPALKDNDFSQERFAPVDAQAKLGLSFADRLVRGSYASWDNFELWNLWVRVWAIGTHSAESNLGSVLTMGQHSTFRPLENPISSPFEPPGYRKYFEDSYAAICDYDERGVSVEETRQRLLKTLSEFEFTFGLRDRNCRGHEWAMKQPLCRDIFLGVPDNHARWVAQRTDAHLA